MNFNEYQKEATKTRVAKYNPGFVYTALGLAGETGEVVEKIKKVLRDNDGVVSEDRREELKKELGDVLWYLSQLSADLDLHFQDVAEFNIEKLKSRQERNQLHGDGDNR